MLNLLYRFVDSNDRVFKRLQPIVDEVNALESDFESLSGNYGLGVWQLT